MRSEISKQNTHRDCGWATGLPHSYLLPPGGEIELVSQTWTHSAPLLCQTPAPSTLSLVFPSLHPTTIGSEKPLSFYKCKCSSQVLSCSQPAPSREWPSQMTGEKGVFEPSADLGSWQGVPTPAQGWDWPSWMLTCSWCCGRLAGLTLIPPWACWRGYN